MLPFLSFAIGGKYCDEFIPLCLFLCILGLCACVYTFADFVLTLPLVLLRAVCLWPEQNQILQAMKR